MLVVSGSAWYFNFFDKWREPKSEPSGVRRIRIRDIHVQSLCIRGGGVQGNRACAHGKHTHNIPSHHSHKRKFSCDYDHIEGSCT